MTMTPQHETEDDEDVISLIAETTDEITTDERNVVIALRLLNTIENTCKSDRDDEFAVRYASEDTLQTLRRAFYELSVCCDRLDLQDKKEEYTDIYHRLRKATKHNAVLQTPNRLQEKLEHNHSAHIRKSLTWDINNILNDQHELLTQQTRQLK
jgi:hypothetical protein